MKKLLITGSNGFVGSYFIHKYKDKYDIKTFSFLKDDINALDCSDVDVVFHLSALVHQMGGASAEEYERVNVSQTLELAKEAKENGVKHFVFMSTVKVYGEETESKYTEDSICHPEDEYGKSNQIRFVYNIAIVPLGYIQHQWARQFKGYSPYVSKDRSSIHSEQRAVDFKILKSIMENPIKGQSVKYNDNRISLFVGQYGKCYVTSKEMNSQNMHCHHKLPKNLGGTDEYKNLVLIEENIHRLVHAVKEETIKRYLSELNLTSEMIDKINKLRGKAKLQKISL